MITTKRFDLSAIARSLTASAYGSASSTAYLTAGNLLNLAGLARINSGSGTGQTDIAIDGSFEDPTQSIAGAAWVTETAFLSITAPSATALAFRASSLTHQAIPPYLRAVITAKSKAAGAYNINELDVAILGDLLR